MPERDRIRANAELGAPFLGDGFGEARDAGFGERVIGLAGVAGGAGCGGDIDDAAGGVVFEAEVGGGGADETEGGGVVEGEDRVPLFVGHLDILEGANGSACCFMPLLHLLFLSFFLLASGLDSC